MARFVWLEGTVWNRKENRRRRRTSSAHAPHSTNSPTKHLETPSTCDLPRGLPTVTLLFYSSECWDCWNIENKFPPKEKETEKDTKTLVLNNKNWSKSIVERNWYFERKRIRSGCKWRRRRFQNVCAICCCECVFVPLKSPSSPIHGIYPQVPPTHTLLLLLHFPFFIRIFFFSIRLFLGKTRGSDPLSLPSDDGWMERGGRKIDRLALVATGDRGSCRRPTLLCMPAYTCTVI